MQWPGLDEAGEMFALSESGKIVRTEPGNLGEIFCGL